MFNFRIIYMSDGNQVIDPSFKTPFNSLTPSQMEDYIEMDKQIAYMERIKEKERRKIEHKRKMERNLLYRFACGLGLA